MTPAPSCLADSVLCLAKPLIITDTTHSHEHKHKPIRHTSTAGETEAHADTAEESSTDAVPRAATASTAEGASSSTSYDPSSCEDAWGSEMDKLGG